MKLLWQTAYQLLQYSSLVCSNLFVVKAWGLEGPFHILFYSILICDTMSFKKAKKNKVQITTNRIARRGTVEDSPITHDQASVEVTKTLTREGR